MLQIETNPKSVALSVWKWQRDEDQGFLENIAKFSDFCILTVFNLDKIGNVADNQQYFYSNWKKSHFMSFLKLVLDLD